MEVDANEEPSQTLTCTNIPCQICKVEKSVYRCPACFIRTCSLVCCNAHKEEHKCNGKRDRTAFVPLGKFTDSTVASDFHFLEDVLAGSDRGKRLIQELGISKQRGNSKRKRIEDDNNNMSQEMPLHPLSKLKLATDKISADACLDMAHELHNDKVSDRDQRDNDINSLVQVCSAKKKTSSKIDPVLSQYPKHKQRLVLKAKERNITLLLMPPGMQRHIMNKTTQYDAKNDMIQWKVEVIFHIISKTAAIKEFSIAERTKTTLIIDRIPENESVHDHLAKAFEKGLSHSSPAETRFILSHFRQNANYEIKNEVLALMKKIPSKSSQPSYYKLDLKNSLGEMLNSMSIIEFPTVEIVSKEDARYFPLMIEEL